MELQEVLRQEKKYLLRIDAGERLYYYLSRILHEDSHNGADGYSVRSLYFDTLQDTDYYEKMAGDFCRRKIRLRIYHPDDAFAKLEIKQKEGVYQKKRSLTVSRVDADKLIRGQYEVLLSYKDDFAAECYGMMKTRGYLPKCVVEYRRKAFVGLENNTRITFDSQIRASETNYDIFDPQLLTYPVLQVWETILEVKYNQFMLSYIKNAVDKCDKSEISMSKYIMARRVTKREAMI